MAALVQLRQLGGFEAQFDPFERIIGLSTYLVTERGMRESPFIYECLMDAMADPKGSAIGIRTLFNDMRNARLTWTDGFCRSALRALAIHPFYPLMLEVLSTMSDLWYTLETEDVQNVVLALLRDNQYELAYVRFMDLIQEGGKPDIWMFDVLATVFGQQRLYTEMMEIFLLRKKKESQGTSYSSLVYQLLDFCSAGFYHAGTALAWEEGVNKGLFDPPDGILDNVLATASVAGDTELAAAAYHKIASRTRVGPQQYIALLEAFCGAYDFPGALRILSIMDSVGVVPSSHETLSIELSRMAKSTGDDNVLDEALAAVRELAAEGKPAANPLRAVLHAIARNRGGEHAMELFKEMPKICGEEPDDFSWRFMIKYTRDLDARRAIVQEYRATIPESAWIWSHFRQYQSLIMACLEIDEVDLAMRFALQGVETLTSKERERWLAWFGPLLRAALRQEDERIWVVYDVLRKKVTKEAKRFLAERLEVVKQDASRGVL